MVSPELSQSHASSPMAKSTGRQRPSSLLSDGFLFAGGAISALLLIWAFSSLTAPNPNPNLSTFATAAAAGSNRTTATVSSPVDGDQGCATSHPTFYDDPKLSYSIGEPVRGWDAKRREWLSHHPSLSGGDRVILLTGSQPGPCRNPIGDHLLLRFFKNKVDYCRLHGCEVFYNNALLHPKMGTFWAKIPLVRATMVAHPEAEWIWWVDSDAAFTDMEFKLPLEKYGDHNLVVHGWPDLIYEKKSWTSLNAGVFLIRNCQWSMEFLEVWAGMGPQSADYSKWGRVQRSMMKDKLFPESDDQAALIYLLLEEKEKWADRIYVEGEYYFEGYWEEIVGTLENTTARYREVEREVRRLRRRHAETESECYGALREPHLWRRNAAAEAVGRTWSRRPFITHFTGCQPCSGNHNQRYSGESCWGGMIRALNFADDQVLRSFGFVHSDALDSSSVHPLPFDYPA